MENKNINDVNATDGVGLTETQNKRELKNYAKDLVRLTNLKRPRNSHFYELRGVLLSMGMNNRAVTKLVKPFRRVN